MSNVSVSDFLQSDRGRLFNKVTEYARPDFQAVLDFLQTPERIRRMKDAELHHDRPALGGVVKELEEPAFFGDDLASLDPHERQRFNQALGYAVKLIMHEEGWKPQGKKGSLGQRDSNNQYHNTEGSLSRYIIRAERYEPVTSGDSD
ncbi:MAG: hypothetical protein WCP21_04410 [Armatimonadota bacterium]